jgi:excisionase family DNA binding protein
VSDKTFGGTSDKLAYGVAEAVRAAGVGRTTLYEAMSSGQLRAVKMGARTLIPASELRRFIDMLPPARPAHVASASEQEAA